MTIARQKATIEKQIVKRMKDLGIYRLEYKNTVDILVGMMHQYENFMEQFEENGYQITEEYTNKAGATNERKTPLLSTIEKLRMDIGTYLNMLCLNPKSFESVTATNNKKSALANILSELDNDEKT